jgi:hypothetical protein
MDTYMCMFFAIDLFVVLWKSPFPWTWLLPYGGFLVSWTWLSSYERFSVPWTWLSSYGKIFVPWTWLLSYGRYFFLFPWTWLLPYEKFLDLIKSWESSHRLNLIVSLLVAISLLICLIAFCFFLFVGVDDAVHVSEEIDEVGITGEVTVVSPPRRPTVTQIST